MTTLLVKMSELRSTIVAAPSIDNLRLEGIHLNYRHSARNLLHYLALRRVDLRLIQHQLASLGLSSLGRSESHVLGAVNSVIDILQRLDGTVVSHASFPDAVDFGLGQKLLQDHARQLLGNETPGRPVRIMVTMPSQAATDGSLIRCLLEKGMECMRINCAHDSQDDWAKMIAHLREAENVVGRKCHVFMDLAGPKLRTGPLVPGPAVLRIRPQRDAFGRVTRSARVCFISNPGGSKAMSTNEGIDIGDIILPVDPQWSASLKLGDSIQFNDSREAPRSLKVRSITTGLCIAETDQTCYLTEGITLTRIPSPETSTTASLLRSQTTTRIGPLPAQENFIILQEGDRLWVTRDQKPGRPAEIDGSGNVITPATVGCTLPEVFDFVEPGHSIWFDDGKIGGVIETVAVDRIVVRITHARPKGEKLREDKGINLPDSPLQLPALTNRDIEDLDFVARNADVVELSFANTARDVEDLQSRLSAYGSKQPAIVLKIETRRAFENLPEMLLVAMRSPCCGVMIARGDLAIECGFERLAEVQEEILWICEAAHVPVIWATQVLESLAKQGTPSRAEITDAAMAHRAECVMLNKGPHIIRAVETLDDILRRMQSHQAKKTPMLRELRLARPMAGAPSTPSR